MRLLLLFIAVPSLCAPAVAQPVLFVDADASGTADGTSWADAFPDLQQALAIAEAGDEVWVAEGTYRPTNNADRDASFVLVSGTGLFGGFDGTEVSRDERDPEQNETFLSGDLGVPDDISDNAFHVVVASGANENTVLDGFTITGGNGNGAEPRNRGGGIYAVSSSLVVRGCRIVENRVVQTDGNGGGGGAFFGGAGHARFEQVVFERNGLDGIGGGLWLLGDIEGGQEGGSMEAEAQRQFRAEVSGTATTAMRTIDRGALSAVLREVAFIDNTGSFGGGMNVRIATIEIVESTFLRNKAANRGGGGSNLLAEAVLVNVGFYGNVADPETSLNSEGGLSSSSSMLSLTNVAFVGNTADFAGALGQGGGGTSVLTNVTFANNEAEVEGGAIRLANGASLTARNSVFWGNPVDEMDATSGFATLQHVLLSGGCPPDASGEATCEAVVDADPLFEHNPDPGPDETWGTADDDYGDLRLQEGSPALDFGRTDFLPPDTSDLDGDGDTEEPLPLDLVGGPRVAGAEVDLGAYERQPPVAAEPESPASTLRLDAYPNPARGPVTVSFDLERTQRAEVALFDVRGRRVAVLHDGPLAAGTHALRLATAVLPSGVYLLRLRGASASRTRRVVILR